MQNSRQDLPTIMRHLTRQIRRLEQGSRDCAFAGEQLMHLMDATAWDVAELHACVRVAQDYWERMLAEVEDEVMQLLVLPLSAVGTGTHAVLNHFCARLQEVRVVLRV